MGYWHPSMVQDLGRLRAEQLMREAEEWRAARHASRPARREARGLALALVWWRALVLGRRVLRTRLAGKEWL